MVLVLLSYHIVMHSLFFGMTRFRLPMVPFLIVAAAPLLTRSWSPLLFGRPVWRPALATVGIALLVLLWSSRWHTIFDVFIPRG